MKIAVFVIIIMLITAGYLFKVVGRCNISLAVALFIAAMGYMGLFRGRAGISVLAAEIIKWRNSLFCYFFAPVMAFGINIPALIAGGALYGNGYFSAGQVKWPAAAAMAVLLMVFILEEIVWRGVFLKEVLKKVNPYIGAGITGIAYSAVFIITGNADTGNMYELIGWIMGAVGVSFILTAVYLRNSSLLMCIYFRIFYQIAQNLGMKVPGGHDLLVVADGAAKLAMGIFILGLCLKMKRQENEKKQ